MSGDSIRWSPQDEPSLHECGEAIEEMLRSGQRLIVKDGPYRTIYRMHLAANDFHVKHCKVRGLRAWLREWLRPAKAKLEYCKLTEALRRNIPTIQPIAYGVTPTNLPGDSFLVTRTVDDAQPLSQFLERITILDTSTAMPCRSTRPYPSQSGGDRGGSSDMALSTACNPSVRIELAVALGKFLARIHHAGLLHPDLHPGNILVRRNDHRFEFCLIDLHDARLGGSLSQRASMQNLMIFNRWFSLRTTRTDRLRFWRAYFIERTRLLGRMVVDYFACRELETATSESNIRFWRRRMTRCLGGSRHFVAIAGPSTAGFAPRSGAPSELQELLADPDAPFRDPATRILKDSPSSTVAELVLTLDGVPQSVIYKRFRCRTSWQAIRSLFRPSKCLRSWMLGHAFLDCLLPTARPLAAFERRRWGLPRDGYLMTEKIENAIDLRQALIEQPRRAQRMELAARLLRRLHERGWSHRDLKAANILLAPNAAGEEKAWLIDLVGAARPFRLTRQRRMRDLARLNASFLDPGCLSRSDRLRFLLCYLNAGLRGRLDWKIWWKGIGEYVERKVEKNRKRGRLLA